MALLLRARWRALVNEFRNSVARKKWPNDYRSAVPYWLAQIWTLGINLYSSHSSIHVMCFVEPSPSDILLFLLLLVGSNVLYLACWLSDPGYIVVSLDQTLQTPPNSHTAVVIDGNGRTAATAGSCEAHFVHTDRTEQTAPESSETSKLLNRPSAHAAVSMPQATTQYDDQYCYLCDFTKPPRSHHCRLCDRCVAKFDHHCPILNTCVGGRTHIFFVGYCCLQSMMMLWAVSSTYQSMNFFGDASTPRASSSDVQSDGPYFLLLNCLRLLTTIVCGFLFTMSLFLFVGHTFLMLRNRTTWEYAQRMRVRRRRMALPPADRDSVKYPGDYDRGMWQNFVEEFTRHLRPEYTYATRRTRYNNWDGTDDVEIDNFDAELDASAKPDAPPTPVLA
ncbi:hypothetical protein PBRA_000550 [Plasmodiophora brassicae]|uniref:Palmitoyltransferase n=1 Tax=Plasmodiophora brassicae TaxID=37360 RepID=A0A0G4IPQ6_PLABS|nr:hypothetical protein PBRA_000550 [Plasmodiophora brassicae]